MRKVLLIEDDPDIGDLLEIHIKDLECELTKCTDGATGLEEGLTGNYDFIILDVMLPKMDGLEVCRRLRGQEIHTPILMLTARSEEIDKILGLETGADDYLTKPFSVREFIARVKAIFRRIEMDQMVSKQLSEPVMEIGDLVIDIGKRKVSLKNERISLTPKEFDLLKLLATNPGKSYSRERLLSIIWGYEFNGYEHTVNSHVNRLRAKIEPDISEPMYILTTWGVGYRFSDELSIKKINS